jgi:hypothetical protein
MQRCTQYSKGLSLSILSLILLVGTLSPAAAQPAPVSEENLANILLLAETWQPSINSCPGQTN